MIQPQDGVAGWDLVEFDWDYETGVAMLSYEHESGETRQFAVAQPTNPNHAGWSLRNRAAQGFLALN